MKRLIVGFLWFLSFFFGSSLLLGFAIAWQGESQEQSEEEIYEAIDEAGEQFSGIILLASAGTAIAGTVTQKLPGTRK